MIVAIANQKGGVGKTTTAINLAIGLKKKKKKVLVVDLDGQGNISTNLRAKKTGVSIYDVLKKQANIKEAIQKLEVDVVAGNALLFGADGEFSQLGREYLLKEALNEVKDSYDFIIIDTPPALGVLTSNAFTASDYVVLTMLSQKYAVDGAGQLASTIKVIKEYSNKDLKFAGILLVNHDSRTVLGKSIKKLVETTVANQFDTKLYKTFIRPCVAVGEAQLKSLSLSEYDPNATANIDYNNFINEFLRGVK